MDIEIYKAIKKGLKEYISSLKLAKPYNPNIVGLDVDKPTYPMIKFQEPNNTAMQGFQGPIETVATLSHKVDIYAKASNGIDKQEIARTLAKICNEYLTWSWGLRQLSYNEIERGGLNGELYHIIITFSTPYYETRQTILRR